MTFDYKKIKEIKISIAKGVWDPQKHDIILSYDSKSDLGFKMKLQPVDPKIENFDDATAILKKYML